MLPGRGKSFSEEDNKRYYEQIDAIERYVDPTAGYANFIEGMNRIPLFAIVVLEVCPFLPMEMFISAIVFMKWIVTAMSFMINLLIFLNMVNIL